jgi:hypothetical protein
VSLDWSPKDKPTPEHMIETAEGFLRHMNWHEHQAVMIAHNDKSYAHVHLILNVVHPETGLRLNDDFERRRAQVWALGYEREHDRIYCEQRLKSPEEREKSPPRNIWMAFQANEKEIQRAEKMLQQNEEIRVDELKNHRNAEWNILKEMQQVERKEFFAQGKSEFSQLRLSIYREVREEFRERWADYYKAVKNGPKVDREILPNVNEILANVKTQLIADRKAVLEPRWDEACKELRESRDERYREILGNQREARAELRWRQEAGLDNAPFFNDLAARKNSDREMTSNFREAAHEVTTSPSLHVSEPRVKESAVGERGSQADVNSERDDVPLNVPRRMSAGAVSILDSLFFDLTTLGSVPAQRASDRDASGRDLFEIAAEEATKQQQHHEREESDAEWRQRSKALYGE